MQMNMTTEQRRHLRDEKLEAPTVDGLLYSDNLVPIELLGDGLTVHINTWPRAHANDELIIKWQGSNIHSFIISDPAAELPYQFLLTKEHLQLNGTYDLTYSVVLDSGEIGSSLPTPITIDNTPPNLGNIPLALEFPTEVVTDGITLEYLSANGDKVVVTVPGYLLMEADQKVHLVWANSHPLPAQALVQADVDQGYVDVEIPGDLIRETGEGRFTAYYYLTSRAGLDGPRSLDSNVDVLLSAPPSGLKAPVVPLAADGLIDLDDADTGVTIEIPPYQNVAAGDQVSARWGSRAIGLYPMPLIGPAEIPVPRVTVIAEGSGSVVVGYHIQRNAHPFPEAPSTPVLVDVDVVGPEDPDPTTPENEALAAPTVIGASGTAPDNELAPEDLNHPASVTVPLYEGAQVGEIVTVYWGYPTRAAALPPYALQQTDIDDGSIPAFSVDVGTMNTTPNDPAWPVYYTVSRSDGKNPVLSLTQKVNVHMSGPGGVDGLEPATFPDLNDRDWLTYSLVHPDGARISVAAYVNMTAGDKVTLDWQAYNDVNVPAGGEIEGTQFSTSIDLTEADVGSELAFVVPYDPHIQLIETLGTKWVGSAKVIYSVTPNGSTKTDAPAATVNIDTYHLA